MSMRYGIFIVSLLFISIFIFMINFAGAGDIMVIEANILKSNASIVSIQVPDYLFFGNFTKGMKSDELKVYVNNTGTVNVSVTPGLVNSSEKIFNYTYFRTRKANPLARIGAFSFNITKADNEYFYISLDLTNYPETINENMLNHQAEIRFIAMAR